MHKDLQFKHWGWTLASLTLMALYILSLIMTDIGAAPETLLKFVQCKYKLAFFKKS